MCQVLQQHIGPVEGAKCDNAFGNLRRAKQARPHSTWSLLPTGFHVSRLAGLLDTIRGEWFWEYQVRRSQHKSVM